MIIISSLLCYVFLYMYISQKMLNQYRKVNDYVMYLSAYRAAENFESFLKNQPPFDKEDTNSDVDLVNEINKNTWEFGQKLLDSKDQVSMFKVVMRAIFGNPNNPKIFFKKGAEILEHLPDRIPQYPSYLYSNETQRIGLYYGFMMSTRVDKFMEMESLLKKSNAENN